MSKRIKSVLTVTLLVLVVLSNLLVGLAEDTYTIEQKASMIVGRDSNSAIVVDGKIYAIGGRDTSNLNSKTIEVYDPESNTWEAKANMITGRRFFGLESSNGKIYVFGGATDDNSFSNKVEEYDIATDVWTTKTNMPTGRHYCRAFTVGNKIYVIGGIKGNGVSDILSTVEIYDPTNDTWETGPSMPFGRSAFSVSRIGSNTYVLGGTVYKDSNKISNSNSVLYLDTQTSTWHTSADMLVGKTRFEAASVGSKIYIYGGYDGSSNAFNMEVYDQQSNVWSTITQISSSSIRDFACVSVGNKIYVIGGCIFPDYYLNKLSVITVPIDTPNSPTNLTATPANAQITLNWNAVDGAESYNVKRSTTQGGSYTTIANNVTTTTYVDTNVTNGTTYYYVVTAVKSGGESENSNEASATPVAPVINRALLHITMQNGFIKEYDMAMTEVDSFLSWYNSTSGSNLYTINKHNNIGPFLNRKDYLVKDKIMYFEVMEYDSQN